MMPAPQNAPAPLRKGAAPPIRRTDPPFDLPDLLGFAVMFAAAIFLLNFLSDPASGTPLEVLRTILNGLFADAAEGVPGE